MEQKIAIEIPDTKTYKSRSFLIVDQNWVKIVKKYVNLRNVIQNERFFLQWRHGKLHNQALGYHSISGFPKKIATFLKLSSVETFTGHAFRRTAATILADNGADVLQLKRLGGWKSSSVAEGYVESSMENQTKTAQMLSLPETPSCSTISTAISTSSQIIKPSANEVPLQDITITNQSQLEGIKISINAYNNSNLVINFNK